MRLEIAREMSHLSQACYLAPPKAPSTYMNPDYFQSQSTPGFVASDDEKVVIAFRGSFTSANTIDEFEKTVTNWLRNLRIWQDDSTGHRIHQGFLEESTMLLPEVREAALDHGAGRKPLYLTGHSAGGALATLAARQLRDIGVPVEAAYVFGSPRVGDRAWANSFTFPVYRFEYMNDLVVHLPPPPSVMELFNNVLDGFLKVLDYFLPDYFATRSSIEYAHAGKLYFVDWDEQLTRVTTGASEFFEATLDYAWGGSLASPMPKALAGLVRVSEILNSIVEQFEVGEFNFLRHHDLQLTIALVTRLLSRG